MLSNVINTIKDLMKAFKSGVRTIYELFKSLSKSKFWWLSPMIIALVLCGICVVVVNTVTTTMPFVYALF